MQLQSRARLSARPFALLPPALRPVSRRHVCRVRRTSSTQQTEPKEHPNRIETPVQLSSLDRPEYDAEKEKSRKFRRVVSALIRCLPCSSLSATGTAMWALLCMAYAAHLAGREPDRIMLLSPTWCSCMRMPCMFEGGPMHAPPAPEPAKAAEPARTQGDMVIVIHPTHLPRGIIYGVEHGNCSLASAECVHAAGICK
jgi:hypothetical protein